MSPPLSLFGWKRWPPGGYEISGVRGPATNDDLAVCMAGVALHGSRTRNYRPTDTQHAHIHSRGRGGRSTEVVDPPTPSVSVACAPTATGEGGKGGEQCQLIQNGGEDRTRDRTDTWNNME
jgi:hypothetical protein